MKLKANLLDEKAVKRSLIRISHDFNKIENIFVPILREEDIQLLKEFLRKSRK